jgi:alkanesulfonate monooxygenase SsuD/methylene tetrahydromethanopterin reductase-like flavin-dependent oxidoreductase (luciferase family)
MNRKLALVAIAFAPLIAGAADTAGRDQSIPRFGVGVGFFSASSSADLSSGARPSPSTCR